MYIDIYIYIRNIESYTLATGKFTLRALADGLKRRPVVDSLARLKVSSSTLRAAGTDENSMEKLHVF